MDFTLVPLYGSLGPTFLETFALMLATGTAGWAGWQLRRVPGAIRRRLLPMLNIARVRRALNRVPLSQDSRGFVQGRRVRVRGVVTAADLSRATLSGLPAALSRYVVEDVSGARIDEGTAAAAFTLALEDGEMVRVAADEAVHRGQLCLIDSSEERWRGERDQHLVGGRFSESRLVPGQRVDVSGVLVARPDPTAPARGYRTIPVRWTLIPDEAPLTVMFATRPRGLAPA